MTPEIITALIAAFVSVFLAILTYAFTKTKEREADWRKEKLEHYKDFVASLNGVISGESTPEGQRSFARACNNLNLVAPQSVIEALRAYQQEIKMSNPKKNDDRHDKLMSKLFFEIRKDLEISPNDDLESFRVGMWASGVSPLKT